MLCFVSNWPNRFTYMDLTQNLFIVRVQFEFQYRKTFIHRGICKICDYLTYINYGSIGSDMSDDRGGSADDEIRYNKTA